MAFAKSLKLKVRKQAHFRCCICRSIGVEVHHIVPQEEAGPDTEENAAPLCPSCHEIYGANPIKRKFIREARDFWYELCASQVTQLGLTANDFYNALQPVATKSDIAEVKEQLAKLLRSEAHVSNGNESDDFVAVPIERYVRSLYDEDFSNAPDLYDLFFDSRAWYEPGSYELLDIRAKFLKLYGEETARRVSFVTAKATGFNPDDFTENEFVDAIHAVHVTVMLITMHKKFAGEGNAVECSVRPDGDFVWRAIEGPKKRSVRKTRSKRRAS